VNFGLDDRTVRFFLNGPIVFGWLMVYASIMSITAFLALGSFYYLLFSGLFFCAVIWSASKGPLLSFFSGIISLFLLTRRFALLWVSFFFILSAFFLIRYGAMPDRLASIERFLLFENEQSDEGSVLLRQHMWRSSLDIIRERPLLGTGLGNWYFYTPVFSLAREVVYYPHNILLELLSEHGFIGFFYILFLFFAILTSSSSMLSRTLMVCGFTGLLFSGDLGYWHFLFGIPLAWRKLPY